MSQPPLPPRDIDNKKTYLHVVYCGRGDALILEYWSNTPSPGRKLVLLDGGPLSAHAMTENGPKRGFVRPAAPYWMYYVATAQERWHAITPITNPPTKPKPFAIIASHLDADHYGGLMHLLRTSWPRDMDFDGPFAFPAKRKGNHAIWEDLGDLLVHQGLKEFRDDTFIPGLDVNFPAGRDISSFRRLGTVQPLPAPETVKDFNPTSLLFQTGLAPPAVPATMFLTGDSDAETIKLNGLDVKPPRVLARPTFSVYKIQHHGSQLDSKFNLEDNFMSATVAKELAIRMIFRLGLKKPCTPDDENDLPNGYELQGVRYIFKCILSYTAKNPAKPQDKDQLEKYLVALDARRAQYVDKIMNGNVAGRLTIQDATTLYFPGLPAPNILFKLIPSWVETPLPLRCRHWIWFYQWNQRFRVGTHRKKEWYSQLLDSDYLAGGLKYVAMVPAIQKFYSLFDAQAYVVSANGTYNHPSPATMIGLILAIKAKNLARKPEIYLTTGVTLDAIAIDKLADSFGLGDIHQYIEIHVLANGRYMTIDAQDEPMPANSTREIRNVTTLIVNRDSDDMTFLKDKLEKNVSNIDWATMRDFDQSNWIVKVSVNVALFSLALKDTPSGGPYKWKPCFDPEPVHGFSPATKISEGWMVDHGERTLWLQQDDKTLLCRIHEIRKEGRLRQFLLAFDDYQLKPPVPGVLSTGQLMEFRKTGDATNPIGFAPLGTVAPNDQVLIQFDKGLKVTQFSLLGDAQPESLAEYLSGKQITPPTNYSTKDAATALSDVDEVEGLKASRPFEMAILSSPVDLTASTVTLDGSSAIAANLQTSTAPVVPVVIDGQSIAPTGATLLLSLGDSQIQQASFQSTLGSDLTLSSVHLGPNSGDITTLSGLFKAMSIDAHPADLTLPDMLAVILQDHDRMSKLFIEQIPMALIKNHLYDFKVDIHQSSVVAIRTATNQIVVESADLVLDMSTNPLWATPTDIAGVQITLGPVHVLATDLSGSDETIAIQATGSFSDAAHSALGLLMRVTLQPSLPPAVTVSMSNTDNVQDMMAALPGTVNLGSQIVPLNRTAPTIGEINATSLGFTIQQAVKYTDDCSVVNVFGSTSLNDWQSYLPASLRTSVAGSGWFRVDFPLVDPIVSAGIDLSIPVPNPQANETSSLDMSFSANGLAPGRYDYRLSFVQSDHAASLATVARTVGLSSLMNDTASNLPIIHSVLETIFVERFEVQVLKDSDNISIGDWLLSGYLGTITLIPNKLVLQSLSGEIEKVQDYYDCRFKAGFDIGTPSQRVTVTGILPSPAREGTLRFHNPTQVTIRQFLSLFEMSDQSTVPVVNTLVGYTDGEAEQLEISLTRVDITMLYNATSDYTITSAGFSVSLLNLSIGSLEFNSIKFEFEYVTAQDLIVVESGITAYTAFTIEANFKALPLLARLSYNTSDSLIIGSLSPRSQLFVRDIFGAFLPSTFVSTLPITNLELFDMSLAIQTDGFSLFNFHLDLGVSQSIQIDEFQVVQLKIDYTASVPAVPATATSPTVPAIPQTLHLVGAISRGPVTALLSISCFSEDPSKPDTYSASLSAPIGQVLTLTNLLALFGLSFDGGNPALPCGQNADFFDVGLQSVTAIVTKTSGANGQSSLSLQSFTAIAVSTNTLTILDNPSIQLDDVRLVVVYDSTKPNKVTGTVSCHLQIAGTDVWLAYARTPAGDDVFTGQAILLSDHVLLHDFGAAIKLPDTIYGMPATIPSLPTKFQGVHVHVEMVRNKSVLLQGVGIGVWTAPAQGVSITTASLGVLLEITKRQVDPTKPNVQPDNDYQAYITGSVQIAGFASDDSAIEAEGKLDVQLGAGRRQLLKASVKPVVTNQSNELGLIAQEIDSTSGWSNIAPTNTVDIKFDSSGLCLYVDFTTSPPPLFALVGTITGVGGALFYSKTISAAGPNPATTAYYLIIDASNISAVWQDFSSSVVHNFNLDKLSVQIASHDTTIAALTADIKALESSVPQEETAMITDIDNVLGAVTTAVQSFPIKRGATFFARIAYSDQKPMSQAFTLMADPTQGPTTTVSLYASVPSDPNLAQFMITVQDFALFGGKLVANGVGLFNVGTATLSVAGTLDIHDILDNDAALQLQVTLVIKPEETVATMRGEIDTSKKVPHPLGMFNVELSALQISVSIRGSSNPAATTRTMITTLGGIAKIGTSSGDSNLTGKIVFVDTSPMYVIIHWTKGNTTPHISDVFSDIITPGADQAGTYPYTQDDFALTDCILSYSRSSTDITVEGDGIIPTGYAIRAKLTLFKAPFDIVLHIPDRSGIIDSAAYLGTIDLDFVKIVGWKKPGEGAVDEGISLGIDTTSGKKLFIVKAGFIFFDKAGFDLNISYDLTQKLLLGLVTYRGDFLGITNPQIKVSYDTQTHEFAILEFPVLQDIAKTVLAIEKIIQLGSAIDNSSGCGEIVEAFGFDKMFSTRHNLTFSNWTRSQDTAQPSSYSVQLEWSFSIHLGLVPTEKPVPIATLHIASMSVDIPGPYSVDKFGEFLTNFIKANAKNMGKALLENRQAFAAILGLVAVDSIPKGVIAKLLCRGLDDEAGRLQKRGEEEANEETDDADKDSDSAEKSADGISGAGGGTAAGGILAAGAGWVAAAAAVAVAAAAITNLKDPNNIRNKIPGSDEKARLAASLQRAEDNFARAQAALDTAEAWICLRLRLSGSPTVSLVSSGPHTFSSYKDSAISVDWSSVKPNYAGFDYSEYKNFSWEYSWADNVDFNNAITAVTNDLSVVIDNDQIITIPQIWVRVRAHFVSSVHTFVSDEWSPISITHIIPMPPTTEATLFCPLGVIAMSNVRAVIGQTSILQGLSPDNERAEDIATAVVATAPSSPLFQTVSIAIEAIPQWVNSVRGLVILPPTSPSSSPVKFRLPVPVSIVGPVTLTASTHDTDTDRGIVYVTFGSVFAEIGQESYSIQIMNGTTELARQTLTQVMVVQMKFTAPDDLAAVIVVVTPFSLPFGYASRSSSLQVALRPIPTPTPPSPSPRPPHLSPTPMVYDKDLTYYDAVRALIIITIPHDAFGVVYGLRLQLSGGGTDELPWQSTNQFGSNGQWEITQEWPTTALLPMRFALRREVSYGPILADWSDWSDVIPIRPPRP